MNINSERATLISHHKSYQACLRSKFDAWLVEQAPSQEAEWCATEKRTYMEHMRKHMPTEYDNMMRMEEGNFWTHKHHNMVIIFNHSTHSFAFVSNTDLTSLITFECCKVDYVHDATQFFCVLS